MDKNKLMFYDGRKAVGIWDEVGWTELNAGGTVPKETPAFYAAVMGWMYRCMSIYANAIASIPLDLIDQRGDVVDSTDDWQNVLGFMPNPEPLFWLLGAATGLSGKAYLYQSKNTFTVVKTLRPLAPYTVEWDDNKQLFTRTRNGKAPKDYEPTIFPDGEVSKAKETIGYIWLPDPDVEWGPPLKFPGAAAASAAGVQFNMDFAAQAFFKRGMMGITAFSVPAGTQKADKERFEESVNRVTMGVKNWFRTVFFEAGKIEPIPLGGNLDQLKDQTLTQEKREDMAAAWGIPLTKLLSTDASGLGGGGVSKSDDLRMYTDTALPALKNILRPLNEQILEPLGYELVERHEQMEIFQTSEQEKSTAFASYVSTFATNPALAMIIAPMLGIEIPEDVLTDLRKFISKDEKPEAPPMVPVPAGEPMANEAEDEIAGELMKWAAFEHKHGGKGRAFECKHIPPRLQVRIRTALRNGGDVDTIFAQAGGDVPALVLAEAINRLQKEG